MATFFSAFGRRPRAGEAGSEAGEACGAFGVGPVEGERSADRRAVAEALLEGEGDADDAPVELGDGDLPGGVERREPGVGGEPGLARRGRADPLHHRALPSSSSAGTSHSSHSSGEPDLLGVGGVGAPAGEHGGDEAIHPVLQQFQSGDPAVRAGPQRVAVDRQGVRPGLFQRSDELVDEGGVPAHPVRAVEDHTDGRPPGVVPREQLVDRGVFRRAAGGRRPPRAVARPARSRSPP